MDGVASAAGSATGWTGGPGGFKTYLCPRSGRRESPRVERSGRGSRRRRAWWLWMVSMLFAAPHPRFLRLLLLRPPHHHLTCSCCLVRRQHSLYRRLLEWDSVVSRRRPCLAGSKKKGVLGVRRRRKKSYRPASNLGLSSPGNLRCTCKSSFREKADDGSLPLAVLLVESWCLSYRRRCPDDRSGWAGIQRFASGKKKGHMDQDERAKALFSPFSLPSLFPSRRMAKSNGGVAG